VASFLRLLGSVAEWRGDFERATELYEESLALSRAAGDGRRIAWSLLNLGNVSCNQGDFERAVEFYGEGLALCRRSGYAVMLPWYLVNLGYVFLLQGDDERATVLNEEAAALYRERGQRGGLEFALDNLGWAALVQGNHERARTLHEESLVLCKELGDKLIALESLEGLACAAGATGGAERAARLFGAAEALRETLASYQSPAERALREPYVVAARSRLNEVSWEAAFIEGQLMTLEVAVEYALSKDEEPDAPQRSSANGLPLALTHREREVAELVARGLTNRQIAEELFVSERTVDNHAANILKKLKVRSREQVAPRLAERRPDSPDLH
jgi:ATP/maltotriose-dependent transcriptional regulator MalT